jgi:cob(I)alamin adenosyltransferase
VCRRAERQGWRLAAQHPIDVLDLKYLNRLSDYFFVLARFFGFLDKIDENNWESNK